MSQRTTRTNRLRGFSLVELAVVVVIVGVLAAFGIPRVLTNAERAKAAEAFQFLSAIQSSQERFRSLNGFYAADVSELDIPYTEPKHFAVSALQTGATSDFETSWSLKLTRTGSASGYGAYTVLYTNRGYDARRSTIAAEIDPTIHYQRYRNPD